MPILVFLRCAVVETTGEREYIIMYIITHNKLVKVFHVFPSLHYTGGGVMGGAFFLSYQRKAISTVLSGDFQETGLPLSVIFLFASGQNHKLKKFYSLSPRTCP